MSRELHHANLLVGTPEAVEAHFRSVSRELGIKLENNPDYLAFKSGTFGIDEARHVSELAARKAFLGKKIFFIAPEKMTLEAQNALLKTVEDPTSDTYFFLALREEAMAIPTLRSRMMLTRISGKGPQTLNAESFLKLPLKKRFEFAKKFAEEGKNLGVFLDELGSVLRKAKSAEALKSIYVLRRFALDNALLPRIILEHVALVV